MGAEDYQVIDNFTKELHREVASVLYECGFAADSPPYNGMSADFLLQETPICFVECELSNDRVSLRLAVCQDENAVQSLSRTVWLLKYLVSSTIFVEEEFDRELGSFENEHEFTDWLRESVRKKRDLWFRDFPSEPKKCKCQDAYDGII